jgi:hypothetical protein
MVVWGGGCAGGEPGTAPTGDRVFVATPTEIQVAPGETGSAQFVLTSGGVPIAAQPVTFEILEVAGSEGKGATLGQASASTDGSGVATVHVTAGEETVFRVVASAGSLQAELVVFVAVSSGSVMIAPFFTPNSSALSRTLSIEVQLFDRTSCADINLAKPQMDGRNDKRSLPPSGGTARFDNVSTTQTCAVVGRALSGPGAVATGCVDVLGQSLVPNGIVQVALPLRDTSPDPVGSYTLSWPLQFAPPLAAEAAIASVWRDLGDCPLDPAQLLLDCTIDALSPATVTDPLDCVPSVVAGGEGPLGDALIARRGTPIVDLAGMVTSCRAARDGAGAPSLDAIAMGLFGAPTPALVVALPAIGADAGHVLDRVDLTSSLVVRSTGHPDEYVVTHVLTGARFGSEVVTLASLALPALTAYTTATTRDGLLVVADHGFSLRLGRVGRAGFGLSALKPRLPEPYTSDASGLIKALADLSRADGASGCAALDHVLCPAAGSAEQCLATACPAGLSALVARLDAVFDAADGQGLDLYLAGSAPLIDMHGDGIAHQLGSNLNEPSAIASWAVDLRTATGAARLTTSFTGARTGN